VVVGVAVNRAWEAVYGPDVTIGLDPVATSLSDALGRTSYVVQQQIGIFGYLEAPMPRVAYLAWYGLLFTLLVLACVVASRRERLTLLAVATAAIVLPALLLAAVMRHTGFGIQGRHVLGFTVVVPLLAGYVIVRNRARLDGLVRSLPVVFGVVAGSVHIVGWLANARRHAVGSEGPLIFFGSAEWSPPLGWMPWTVGMVGAFVALVFVAAGESMDAKAPIETGSGSTASTAR
jgi:hypothetical protein